MAEFSVQLLGPMRVWRDGVELQVGSPQQQAVLAALLLSRGGHVSLEALIDALWGERPPKASTGAVRTYVSRIRHALCAGAPECGLVIDSTGDGYALQAERITVDVDLFEARIAEANLVAEQDNERAAQLCRHALSLWRGTPLAGVSGPSAEPVRARMVELRADAVEIESAALIAAGDHLAAIAGLRALVVDLPLRESLHELLMLALYRAGRRADALEVYAGVRRLLREELGVEPGVSLRRMHRRVLGSDDPEDARIPAPAPLEPRTPPTASRLPAALRDLVGRGDLLQAVSRTLGGGGSGRRVAVLGGMPGVGKSALAIAAGHLLEDRFPDGQVLLELGGAESPMRPGEVLAELLHAVGGPAYRPTAELAPLALAAAWREQLAGRRLLVVLDDVDSVEQVRAVLAAPAGCGFIVASRGTLMIEDAVQYEVPALDEAASLLLLERLIGVSRMDAEPAAARLLIAQCGGLPSMLRSVGARLASRPQWSLASAGRHLTESIEHRPPEDGDAGADPLLSALRGLTAEQSLVLRGAAQLDEPWVQVAQAAAAVGLPETTVREVCEGLSDIHLLRPAAWGTYGLHPAVGRLALLCAEPEASGPRAR
jgi:DNA-binding SARP family transcriptional activator